MNQNRQPVAVVAVILLAGAAACLIWHSRIADHRSATAAQMRAASSDIREIHSRATPTLRLKPEQVLVVVNGRAIKVTDVIPVNKPDGNVTMDRQSLNYLLKRAVDRELIFQTAEKRGITLGESQYQQLETLRAARNQPEPGRIAQLNGDPAGNRLEFLDAEAFMLETTMMADQGMSPNVTEDEVLAYFQQHQAEFGELPADPGERSRIWQELDFQIRTRLAPSVRADYNRQLVTFLNRLESQSTVTPVVSE